MVQLRNCKWTCRKTEHLNIYNHIEYIYFFMKRRNFLRSVCDLGIYKKCCMGTLWMYVQTLCDPTLIANDTSSATQVSKWVAFIYSVKFDMSFLLNKFILLHYLLFICSCQRFFRKTNIIKLNESWQGKIIIVKNTTGVVEFRFCLF